MPSETVASGFNGIYEPSQAARYVYASSDYKISPRNVIYWIRVGLALPDLMKVDGRRLLLTFEDLISLRMVVIFRQARFSIQHIKEVEHYFRKVTGFSRPFATISLWTGRQDIIGGLQGRLVSGSRGGQEAFEFVRASLKQIDLSFNEEGIASVWRVFPYVSLQPTIQFGEPCIDGTRIPTSAIWGMFKAGDSLALLMRSFGVSQIQIEEAIAWERKLEEVA